LKGQKMAEEMGVVMHPSVKKVVEFMVRNLEEDELRGVAEALHLIAPVICRYHPVTIVLPVYLDEVVNCSSSQLIAKQ
jgi:hypothetical protein